MKYRILIAVVVLVITFVLWINFGQDDDPGQAAPAAQSDGLYLK